MPGQACKGRSVALFTGFLSQIWKFSSSHTGKQAQSQTNLDPGTPPFWLPVLTEHEKSPASLEEGRSRLQLDLGEARSLRHTSVRGFN